ncbi:hypothetical protein BpHYR1_048105 [Brachionus plicatilis]|uniref:Uncharacterized protein n=1 Tax=Brachionus plicatilis TaxID=10195 RepID=A0A3M7R6T9_BRAPC|nr:hypothetical protein BpHYR1_048105 [Brachionus plicatilis]
MRFFFLNVELNIFRLTGIYECNSTFKKNKNFLSPSPLCPNPLTSFFAPCPPLPWSPVEPACIFLICKLIASSVTAMKCSLTKSKSMGLHKFFKLWSNLHFFTLILRILAISLVSHSTSSRVK